ncbi:MAG: hypothetical protein M0R46_09695 [Candidatus Muirbacterium halophilum]|nr:hypothetical protein [Candidatus Muirbacterium halophilum]MCK9476182.1 hypothetical protein [Candidatus Muirbacterium halophilum]
MNKKAFATYYIMFFLFFIMILSFVYYNRVSNTGKNIVRDFEKLKAKNLCDLGVSASMNIIYKNYARGNTQFYRSLKYPIKKDYPSGSVHIQKIDILDKFLLNGKNYSLKFQDIPVLIKGINIGKYDIFEISIKGVSIKGHEVKTKALIKAEKVLRME